MKSFSTPVARSTSMRSRSRAKVNRKEQRNVDKPHSGTPEEATPLPTSLCHVDEASISAMEPGDIFLVDEMDFPGMSPEPAFYAVLACPLCGKQGLISAAQYFGFAPVICGAKACPCLFKILDEERLVYLPTN